MTQTDRKQVARRLRGLWVQRVLSMLLGLLVLGGCDATQQSRSELPAVTAAHAAAGPARQQESLMWMTVGGRRFAVALTDNAAARALAAQLPLTLDMSELNGNEKHARVPRALPANASRPGTIRSGDVMLYGAETLVVFYSTINSSYSYTRLGRVDDPADLPQAVGRGDVRIVFSKD
jgi:hypothetical protein